MNPELQFSIESVRNAGQLLLTYFRKDYQVRQKSKDNPVTPADLAVDAQLRESFKRQFPEDGWLSEETADSAERLARRRIWVVDPLDGTREFVQGHPEFAVSVALVENLTARIAVVYNPARDDLFAAEKGGGAYRNGSQMQVSTIRDLKGARILTSRSETSHPVLASLEEWGNFKSIGSIAYKLALVAAQEADITISLLPKSEWDVCAGSLLIHEAGGRITDLAGRRLLFNQPNPSIHGIIASNPVLHELALQRLRQHPQFAPPPE